MLLKVFAALSAAVTALNAFTIDADKGLLVIAGLAVVRFVVYYFGLILAYALWGYVFTELTVKFDKPQPTPSSFWMWNMRQMSEVVVFVMRINVILTGREKLPRGQRYLLVCNHRSFFDPIVHQKTLGDEGYVYISKRENFKLPIAGKVMHKCACMPLERDNNRQALGVVKHSAELIEDDVASIVIYPEGTRSKKPELLPYHAGSFKIAQRAAVPVVVCALYGTDKVLHNFPFKRSDVHLAVLDVIDAQFVKTHSTKETAELAQSITQQWYDEMKNPKEKQLTNV